MRRNQPRRLSNFAAGAIALVVTVIAVYFGFTKAIPFQHHFTISAVFPTANNLRPASPVRIAGVNVGKVVAVQHLRPGEPGALVKMRIDDKGLPIHKDASFAIRPRIFLEGNFFVDVHPGTPSAPAVHDGETLRAPHTSTPVQFDQILTSLQSDTRQNLRTLLYEYSVGVGDGGSRGFNASIPYWLPAYKNSAIVNEATLGSHPHDLSGYIRGAGITAQALDNSPPAIQNLITDFNTTAHAFAVQQDNLSATVAELPRTLRAAEPALRSLNNAFPPLRRLIVDFRPAVRSSLPAINASLPFVAQARKLVSRPELRGLVADLKPTVPALAQLNAASVPLYGQVRAASSCQNQVILPWSQDQLVDPNFPTQAGNGNTTQLKVYQESVRYLPGIASESRTGDANQQWFRVLPGNGANIYNLTGLPAGAGGVFGATNLPLAGVKPGKVNRPPLKPTVACETQVAPNLSATQQAPPTKVMTTPNHTKLGDQGVALFTAQLVQQMRREALGAHPSSAQLRSMRATELKLDALATYIKAQILHGAKLGDQRHGFRGAGQ
jgi:phospholipid/cholesterol/gamma-HCH transport system substrate-binding protein